MGKSWFYGVGLYSWLKGGVVLFTCFKDIGVVLGFIDFFILVFRMFFFDFFLKSRFVGGGRESYKFSSFVFWILEFRFS